MLDLTLHIEAAEEYLQSATRSYTQWNKNAPTIALFASILRDLEIVKTLRELRGHKTAPPKGA
jgi:hypothetical protein